MFYVYVESRGWLTEPGKAWSFNWENAEEFSSLDTALEAAAARTSQQCIVLEQVGEL